MQLGKLLRAKDDTSVRDRFTIYIPDRDRHQKAIKDIGTWIDSAVQLMVEINGGCTRLAVAKGHWVTDTKDFVAEDTTIIYSYLLKPEKFQSDFYRIVEFFHAFGRDTDQDALFAELSYFDGKSYVQEAFEIPHENYLPPTQAS
jgi:hypothetical protein